MTFTDGTGACLKEEYLPTSSLQQYTICLRFFDSNMTHEFDIVFNRYLSFFLHGPANWMDLFRADFGGQVSFAVFAAEAEEAEFRGSEYAGFWPGLGKRD